MLKIDKCCLVVIDVQGKLAQLMTAKKPLIKNIQIVIKAAKILNVPIIWTQQVPQALGPTLPEISELLQNLTPVDKQAFSCCGNDSFTKQLDRINCNQIILCGIETHICVYQTAMDLLAQNKDVFVLSDAVSSRTTDNKCIALDMMLAKNINVCSVEMVLFELLKTSSHPNFKEIAKLIK